MGGAVLCPYWNIQDITQDMASLPLYVMLLPKLPFVDVKNALFTAMVFHAALLLIKELTSQESSVAVGPC